MSITPTPFGRLVTAMVTPFAADGSVDLELAGRLACHLVEQGSDAVLVSGTTGESPTLSWEEVHDLLRAIRAAVGDRAQVLAGTGSNCTEEAVAATRQALALGADGALLVVPYYNKPPQEGLAAHFRAIAEAVPAMPLMLYNIPGRTGCSLAARTTATLMDLDNVVAYKAASGTTDEVSELRRLCGNGLAVYSGDDSLTLPMLAVGAVGVVSVVSHLEGLRVKAMIEAYLAGRVQAATELHDLLLPLMKALFIRPNPIPVKAALAISGWPVGNPRLPLIPAEDCVTQQLSELMATLRST